MTFDAGVVVALVLALLALLVILAPWWVGFACVRLLGCRRHRSLPSPRTVRDELEDFPGTPAPDLPDMVEPSRPWPRS